MIRRAGGARGGRVRRELRLVIASGTLAIPLPVDHRRTRPRREVTSPRAALARPSASTRRSSRAEGWSTRPRRPKIPARLVSRGGDTTRRNSARAPENALGERRADGRRAGIGERGLSRRALAHLRGEARRSEEHARVGPIPAPPRVRRGLAYFAGRVVVVVCETRTRSFASQRIRFCAFSFACVCGLFRHIVKHQRVAQSKKTTFWTKS